MAQNVTLHDTIKKLQNAINSKGGMITYSKNQFYTPNRTNPCNMHIIKKATKLDNGKFEYQVIFRTASTLQCVLFLRDYWFTMNGWDLPTDNIVWNKKREEYDVEKYGQYGKFDNI